MKIVSIYLLNLVVTLSLSGRLLAAVHMDTKNNFALEYDSSTWHVDEKKKGTPAKDKVDESMKDRTLVNLERTVSDEKYHARFTVVMDPLAPLKISGTPEFKLQAYLKHARKFLTDQKFNIVTVKDPGTNKEDGCYLENVKKPCFDITAKQRDFGLTLRQILFVDGDNAYLLTGASRIAKFDAYAPEFKGLFESFRRLDSEKK